MQNYCRENQLERAIRRHSNIIENWTNYRSAIRKNSCKSYTGSNTEQLMEGSTLHV